jgi:tRNA G18 (ribose-2'-O)-methylase SpoU
VRDPELLRAHGVFVAEGRLVVERLLTQSRFPARSVLVTPAAHASLAFALDRVSCPVYLVASAVLERIAGYHIHRGCLAIGERGISARIEDLVGADGPLVCLESVGNPDNIGGVFRNAAAFGAAGVILSPGCSDPLYRKSIRTSMGATLAVPFAVAGDWPATISGLRESGRHVVALTLAEDAADLGLAARTLAGESVALLLGHEGHGLSMDAQTLASVRVRIPMVSAVDSLNVASAAAIALYAVTAGRYRQAPERSPR